MDTETWQTLMDRVMADAGATLTPLPPGPGTTEGDPLGLSYVNLGHLALIMNEAVDAIENRGVDRGQLLDTVADNAGEQFSRADVDAILSGSQKCPDIELLQSFCAALTIDTETAVDAAIRDGCTNYGASTTPPGY